MYFSPDHNQTHRVYQTLLLFILHLVCSQTETNSVSARWYLVVLLSTLIDDKLATDDLYQTFSCPISFVEEGKVDGPSSVRDFLQSANAWAR